MKLLSDAGKIGFLLCAALLVTWTGYVSHLDGPRAGTAYVEPVFIEHDDYVYHPRYRMYYGSRSHQYYYQEGRSWVSHRDPRRVSVHALAASPSVAVDFHDRPPAHHAEVI